MAGYRHGTTTFLRITSSNRFPPQAIAPLPDNSAGFYLGPPASLAGAPIATARPDYPQYNHLTGPFPGKLGANYFSAIGLGTWYDATWSLVSLPPYYNPFLTNVTPHLLPDQHPLWSGAPVGSTGVNPVWCPSNPSRNPFLYWHPTDNRINPPGAMNVNARLHPYAWLDLTGLFGAPPPPIPFGVIAGPTTPKFGGPATLALYDNWCLGYDPATPGQPVRDVFPDTGARTDPLIAVRYSLEHKKTPWSPTCSTPQSICPSDVDPNTTPKNLQSFTIVIEER